MARRPFHHALLNEGKTWLARAAFIGGVSALAFAATTHADTGVAEAQTRTLEARAEEADYIITLTASGAYTAGKQGTLVMKLVPKGAYKIDTKFPMKIVTGDPPGVKVAYAKKKLEAADGTVSDTSAVFNIQFTPQQAGAVTVMGKFHFKVCTDKCNTHNIDMSLTVEAGAAATP